MLTVNKINIQSPKLEILQLLFMEGEGEKEIMLIRVGNAQRSPTVSHRYSPNGILGFPLVPKRGCTQGKLQPPKPACFFFTCSSFQGYSP